MNCRTAARYGLVLAVVAYGSLAPTYADDDPAPNAAADGHTTDLRDLLNRVKHRHAVQTRATQTPVDRPFLIVTPSITSKPSTGPTFGVAATLALLRGDPETTHLSTAAASLKFSLMGQTLSSVRFGVFTSDDSWFLQGENRLWWTSLDTHALGIERTDAAQNLKYDWFRFYDTAYRRVGASRVFVGVGVNVNRHARVGANDDDDDDGTFAESAYVQYSNKNRFNLGGQTSAGSNVAFLFDTRDNAINAQRGWMASSAYRTFFSGFLGGASTRQELNFDVRTYRALARNSRQRIAVWVLGDFVTGGTPPFLDLPSTSGDLYGRSARGYAEGQFRGPHLLYGEVEYRGTLTSNGLVGMVAFANVTTLDSEEPNQRLFHSFAPAAGAGLRLLLDKHTRTNLCADYAIGIDGSRGLYLAVQEAF